VANSPTGAGDRAEQKGAGVDLAELQWLAGPTGRAVLAGLPPYRPERAMAESARLRAEGLEPAQAAAVLTQARLRAGVARRWGRQWHDLAADLLFTPEGAEQATRPVVAALRAGRYAALGDGAAVADLGCGIGLDTMALAGHGLAVDAFDSDELTAAAAAINVDRVSWTHPPSVTCADVCEMPPRGWMRYAGVFADPARRRTGNRVHDPRQWSPPLPWVLAIPVPDLGVKVAPGLDRSSVATGTEFAVVSVGGVVVEAGLYRGRLRTPGVSRSATVLPRAGSPGLRWAAGLTHVTLTDLDLPGEPPEVRHLGRFLHEPDGAVIRAGLVTALAARSDSWLIDPDIAYLSSDRPVAASTLQHSYEVTAALPFSLKSLRAHLRGEDVGHVVVKKRGSAIDVDQLRRSLRLDSDKPGRRVVLLTRIGSSPIAVVAVPVTGTDRDGGAPWSDSGDRFEGGDEVPVVDER
jgi:hypothetical protein